MRTRGGGTQARGEQAHTQQPRLFSSNRRDAADEILIRCPASSLVSFFTQALGGAARDGESDVEAPLELDRFERPAYGAFIDP